MTKLAQSVTSLTNNHRSMLHGELPHAQVAAAQAADQDDGLLPLTGGVPVTVNLSIFAGTIPVFWREPSSPDAATQLYTGIKWKPDVYALMITFAFAKLPENVVLPPTLPPLPVLPPHTPSINAMVSELIPTTPTLWFSDSYPESDPSAQMCCVPSTLGEYFFDVQITDEVGNTTRAKSLDPKIIVTPIING